MNEVPHKALDACRAWEERVENLLADPVVPVEQAIATAVHMGRMTADEGQECINAYIATFFPEHPEDAA